MSEFSYRERRQRIHELMSEAGLLINEAGDRRYQLWAAAVDDLSDALMADDGLLEGLREAFVAASREFWLRENQLPEQHSVRVPQLWRVK